jgi:hypothetical protein
VDRRGSVVWWDDFEEGAAAKWKVIPLTVGTAALSTDRAWTGSTSLKVTTAAAALDYVTFVKACASSFSHRSGLEMSYCRTVAQPYVDMYLFGYSGTAYFEAGFRHDFATAKIYYEDDTATFIELPKYDPQIVDREHWIPVKIVADWDKQEYIRLIFAGTEYDLSGIPLYNAASAELQHLRPQIKTWSSAAASCVVYYDNIILTCNE